MLKVKTHFDSYLQAQEKMKSVFVRVTIQVSLITVCIRICSSIYHDNRMQIGAATMQLQKEDIWPTFCRTNSDFLAEPIPSLTLNTADICNSLFTTNGTERFASLSPCKKRPLLDITRAICSVLSWVRLKCLIQFSLTSTHFGAPGKL